MLKSKLEHFYSAVDRARQRAGESPARIADAVIAEAFPLSYDATRGEGCDDMLRIGVIKAITRYITKPKAADRQAHFNDIEPSLMPLVEPLSKSAYLVPSAQGSEVDEDTRTIGFYIPVADLVRDIEALRAARDFLAMKAGHVQSEADKLSALLLHIEAAA
jgi:hypothetical protein